MNYKLVNLIEIIIISVISKVIPLLSFCLRNYFSRLHRTYVSLKNHDNLAHVKCHIYYQDWICIFNDSVGCRRHGVGACVAYAKLSVLHYSNRSMSVADLKIYTSMPKENTYIFSRPLRQR